MTTIATRVQAIQQIGMGKTKTINFAGLSAGAPTTAAAASGHITYGIQTNNVGTTYPGTLVSFPTVKLPTDNFRHLFTTFWSNNAAKSGYLGIFYKMGTVDFTASGNSFTPDAATFPVLRTNLFGANQALSLWPVLYVTTATTTTAPAFILQTSGAAAGYTSQTGGAVIGTKTFTLPSAATAIQSTYILRTEDDGTSGVQAINQINMTSSAAVGAGTIYGFEKLATLTQPFIINSVYDGLLGCLDLRNHTPAVATSGTATSFLGILTLGSGATQMYGQTVIARDS